MANPLSRVRSFFRRQPAPSFKVDPNQPIALYFEPSGRVRPITMKSLAGGWGGEYDSLNRSMFRDGNATPSEIGYAYLSEINVWIRRCIEIRASNIKRMDWYVEDTRTSKRWDSHPLAVAMKRSRHLMLRTERSLLTWGELYLKPLRNDYGYYADLWWLNNLSVNLTIVNGFVTQFYYSPLHGGKPYTWRADEMCYIYTENAFDDLRGSSKILAVLNEANVHEEIARAAQAHYANDARPGLMLLPESNIGTDRAQEFMDYWKDNFQGSWNANKPMMLPYTIKSIQTLERAKLEGDAEFRAVIRREICAGFGVPLSVAGAWDDANYQSAPEQRISLYEETIIPEADQIKDDFNRTLMPFFDDSGYARVNYDAKELLALAEDKQAKAAALNQQLVSGGITLNQYREAMDIEAIPEGNVFYIPSGVVVTPVEKLGTMPPPAPPGGSPFGLSAPDVSVEAPAPPALPAPEEPAKSAGSMTALLSLANDTGLIQLQNQLKQALNDPSIQWTDPSAFHITLVHVPAVEGGQVDDLLNTGDLTVPELQLNVGSLASFDKAGRYPIIFRIRENAALRACQRELALMCQDAGMRISPYNTPDAWQPHVTMGYSPARLPRKKMDTGLRIAPAELVVSVAQDGQREEVYRGACGTPDTVMMAAKGEVAAVDSGASITGAVWKLPERAIVTVGTAEQTITITPDPDTAFLNELASYRKFILNRWGQPLRPFRFNVITDPLQSELVQQVKTCTSKAQVHKLFDGLMEALKQTEDDDPDIVTPEQAQEWWHDYDRLMKELGNDWLREYMREVWRKLEPRLNREIETADVQALLQDFHPDLIQKWTGTADEPGVIAKLFMAGMGAGQQALVRKRTNMNPQKAAELVIDWELIPSDAIAAVEKYVGKLIRGIDATTLADVQKIIAQWLESGGSIADLTEQLAPVFKDPARARLIAQTESSNAYHQGAIQRWSDAGVTQMKFKTVQDSIVCPECKSLAGKIGTLENGWNGVKIPVHPGCRCYASPVL